MSNQTIQRVSVINKGHKYVDKTRTVPEVFDIVANQESNEEKVAMLRAYDTKGLRYVINGMYNIDWSDVKIPKYKPNHAPSGKSNLNINNAVKRIETAYKFRYSNPTVSEKNLLIVLEEVSALEAELLVQMMKGKKVKGISKTVFKEAFPVFFRMEESSDSKED